MSGNAYTNTEALLLLEEALTRFLSKLNESLSVPLRNADSATARLEDQEDELSYLIADYEDEADEADQEEDGDGSDLRLAAEEARQDKAKLQTTRVAIEGARGQFQREARSLCVMCENAPQARQFLRGAHEDLLAYLAYDIELGDISKTGIERDGISNQTSSILDPQTTTDRPPSSLSSSPLPAGFSWMSLAQLESTDDLARPEDWKKTPQEQMVKGFKSLHSEILKTFQTFGTSTGREWFQSQDRANKLSYEDGLECVFDAFFGGDPIAISRNEATNGNQIIDGRHRIEVARKLGWSDVPVIFTGIQK